MRAASRPRVTSPMEHPLLDDRPIGRIGVDGMAVLAASRCRTPTDSGLETWFVRVPADGLLDDFGAISRVDRVIAVTMKDDGRHATPPRCAQGARSCSIGHSGQARAPLHGCESRGHVVGGAIR